ncbi:MAG: hypothetical protein PHN18_05095 [Sulfurospirillaceae bacterium]|nr:hypothetical protein [Sulfurospirillaceae bacterium]MDD2825685.1 hypothetical protein [Sulfurospirillaceae bacterium]
MFGLFTKKDQKPKSDHANNYTCHTCGHNCSKCETPFCYACYTESGVCPSCGSETVKNPLFSAKQALHVRN